MNTDSTQETLAHIRRVQELLAEVQQQLAKRSIYHDRSKLESPEKEGFDEVTNVLRGITYGSPEYKAQLEKLKPVLDHHYAENSHHPEHYEKGVGGMNLLDLVEMFCDWKAATERHADGSVEKSIQHNKGRFKLSDQLVAILENTRRDFGW